MVVDYKTRKMSSLSDVAKSLQLSIYAFACRDAVGVAATTRDASAASSQRARSKRRFQRHGGDRRRVAS